MEDYKRCAWCETLLLASSATGITGKKDDALALSACPHALHAECLQRWYYSSRTPEQQAILNRKPFTRNLRTMAAYEYTCAFENRCESCARSESAPAQ